MLIFQTDVIFCSKSNTTILDYLEYDYVGAVWTQSSNFVLVDFFGNGEKLGIIGNGGASFRKKSAMIQATSKM